jgi:hypothetical protein
MEDFGLFHLVYFTAVWYILWLNGNFPILVFCTKKNLATPVQSMFHII